jgi:hypothetical protein
MTSSTREQALTVRHRVIDRPRAAREQGQPLATSQDELYALLEEVDQLQLVAHAADDIVLFPSAVREEPEAVLQGALRFWKAY